MQNQLFLMKYKLICFTWLVCR